MKILLTIALALCTAFAACAADPILIYRGTIRYTFGPAGIYPPSLGFYLVSDPAAQTLTSFFFWTKGRDKKYAAGLPQPMHVIAVPMPGGKTASVFSTSTQTFTATDDFEDSIVYFRGTQVSLAVRSTPDGLTLDQPRVLTATVRNASSTPGSPYFIEASGVVSFQVRATLDANNQSKSAADVIDDLGAFYSKRGYTPEADAPSRAASVH